MMFTIVTDCCNWYDFLQKKFSWEISQYGQENLHKKRDEILRNSFASSKRIIIRSRLNVDFKKKKQLTNIIFALTRPSLFSFFSDENDDH